MGQRVWEGVVDCCLDVMGRVVLGGGWDEVSGDIYGMRLWCVLYFVLGLGVLDCCGVRNIYDL